jgi:oxygen-independent coproporphyrinogen-3 oxidase
MPASRKALGRGGSPEQLHRALSSLGEIYGGEYSADLMSGIPFQTEELLLGDIRTLLSYNPAHVSLYDLTLDEKTPLYKNAAASKIILPAAEEAERLWISGRDALEASGYAQYEVSNFARDGKRSKHNLGYWRMTGWLGAGPGASGTVIDDESGTGIRRTIKADVQKYVCGGRGLTQTEKLDKDTLIKESLMMGFRATDGPDNNLFKKRFGVTIEETIPDTLRKWRGSRKIAAGKTALTKEGLLLLNVFLRDCFREVDG